MTWERIPPICHHYPLNDERVDGYIEVLDRWQQQPGIQPCDDTRYDSHLRWFIELWSQHPAGGA